jgi:hypothetical protein
MGVGGRSNCQRDKRTRHPVWILVLVLTPHTSLVHVHHSQSSNPSHTRTRTCRTPSRLLASSSHLLINSPFNLVVDTSSLLHSPSDVQSPPSSVPPIVAKHSTRLCHDRRPHLAASHRIASHHITTASSCSVTTPSD